MKQYFEANFHNETLETNIKKAIVGHTAWNKTDMNQRFFCLLRESRIFSRKFKHIYANIKNAIDGRNPFLLGRESKKTKVMFKKSKHTQFAQHGRKIPSFIRETQNINRAPRPRIQTFLRAFFLEILK